MPANQKIAQFIDHLKKTHGEDGAKQFVQGLFKATAAETYAAVVFFLTDDDLTVIDQIKDEKEAEKEIQD